MHNFFASIRCCSSLEIEFQRISSVEAVEVMLVVLDGSLSTPHFPIDEIQCLSYLFVSAF